MSIAVAEEPKNGGESLNIAIVGVGPRGLSVLERLLVRLAGRTVDRPVHIFTVDPGEPGAGRIWRTDQPEWFAMNTSAGEVTMYSDGPDGGSARPGAGPSLHQWLQGHPDPRWSRLCPSDYAPRAVYGQYLNGVFRSLITHLPPGVQVHPVRARVDRIQRKGDDYVLFLSTRLDDTVRPDMLTARKVVLTTGHPRNVPGPRDQELQAFSAARAGLRYLQSDSVADLDLDSIRPANPVGVVGLGLSFYDVLLCLTEGRGGRFEEDGDEGLRYLPSGAEPRIVAGSRSGYPLPARGRNQKAPHYRYRSVFLTEAAVAAARARHLAERGSPQLDFRDDVLPLLQLEIEHVYYTAHVRLRHGVDAADRFARHHAAIHACVATGAGAVNGAGETTDAIRPAATNRRLAGLLREFGVAGVPPVDLVRLARPFRGQQFSTPDEFHGHLLRMLRADVAEAALGNVDGPLKAALDIMRDLRAVVRSAVDFGGLHPTSHRDFLTWYNPINSLLSAGPPAIRVAQLCALVKCGILTVAGPDTQFQVDPPAGRFALWSPRVRGSRRLVTVLIDARIPRPHVRHDASPLIRQMLEDGLISEFVNSDPVDGDRFPTGGLAVTTAQFRVIDAFGRASDGIYALGIPTENTRWFTQIGNSRPGPMAGFHRDADAIAADALSSAGPLDADPVPAHTPARQANRRARRTFTDGERGSTTWL
jgi:hypothetical protein